MLKGWEVSGSPGWTRSELLRGGDIKIEDISLNQLINLPFGFINAT